MRGWFNRVVLVVYLGCLPAGSRQTSGSHPQLFYHSDPSTDTLYSSLVRTEKDVLSKSFTQMGPCSRTLTYCWCKSVPRGSWRTPDELPACDSAAQQPPSSDAGWSVGSRNPETCPSWARIAPSLKTTQRKGGGASAVWWLNACYQPEAGLNQCPPHGGKRAHHSDRSRHRMLVNRDR